MARRVRSSGFAGDKQSVPVQPTDRDLLEPAAIRGEPEGPGLNALILGRLGKAGDQPDQALIRRVFEVSRRWRRPAIGMGMVDSDNVVRLRAQLAQKLELNFGIDFESVATGGRCQIAALHDPRHACGGTAAAGPADEQAAAFFRESRTGERFDSREIALRNFEPRRHTTPRRRRSMVAEGN